jgi:hypothetical protein
VKGHAVIDANVTLYDNHGEIVSTVNGELATRTIKTMRTSDKYKSLMGDGHARVSVRMDENMGGPYGYSSVKIGINVSLVCDQNEKSIADASQACLTEAMNFIDATMPTAHKMLVEHLELIYRNEDKK